ncbi:MAG: copper chaperone PCu(A)C [Pseudomonadota bacterium]
MPRIFPIPISLRHLPFGAFILALVAACAPEAGPDNTNPRTVSRQDAAVCAPDSGSAITVSAPWARPARTVGGTSAIYFTLCGNTNTDMLLRAETTVADATEIHETRTDAAGRRAMMPVSSLTIPKAAPLSFEPGGLHVMLIGLKAPLEVETTLDLTLIFEKAGPVAVRVPVKKQAASGASTPSTDHHRSGS